MAALPVGSIVAVLSPTGRLPSGATDAMVTDYGLAVAADLAAKADASTVTTLSTTVSGHTTTLAAKADASALSAKADASSVPTTAKAALVALGLIPVIAYSAGWPTRSTWVAANYNGYTGTVEWDSSTAGSAITAPPTGAIGDRWTRAKSA